MDTPNWLENEERLFHVAVEALQRFEAAEEATCAHFAFEADPLYGYVLCAFDTVENSWQAARENEAVARRRRQQAFHGEGGWRFAKYVLGQPTVAPFGNNTGDFAFQHFAEVQFPEWRAYWEATQGVEETGEEGDDYLGGQVRVLLWKVVERLIESGAFASLKKASPFLISYAIHDEEQRVLRVLEWPPSA